MDLDINTLRIGATLLSFVTFIGILVWTWSRSNAAGFEEASRLPFEDE